MLCDRFEVCLPSWLAGASPPCEVTVEGRMRAALALARRNVREGTGGPFGAAVFRLEDGAPVAAGVNLVVSSGLSAAHAEVVALSLAQRALGTHDLSPFGLELACSAEPCAMCLGAIRWSGVRSLAVSARDADVRAIGFDEGEKPADWTAELRGSGVGVVVDVLRDEGIEVLRAYSAVGGPIYNPRWTGGTG
jgi:tRNA(Arg) A34 adenosine deaminase TadA